MAYKLLNEPYIVAIGIPWRHSGISRPEPRADRPRQALGQNLIVKAFYSLKLVFHLLPNRPLLPLAARIDQISFKVRIRHAKADNSYPFPGPDLID